MILLIRARRRTAQLSSAILLAYLLTACGSSPQSPAQFIETSPVSSSSDVTATGTPITPHSEAPQVPKVSYPLHTGSFTATDGDGYSILVTVSAGDFVKGTDTARVAAGWAAVGGRGQMPLTDGTYSGQSYVNVPVDHENLIYIFGAIALTDQSSSGFSISGSNSIVDHPSVSLLGKRDANDAIFGRKNLALSEAAVWCVSYSNSSSTKCSADDRMSLNPSWSPGSKRWGPVPFVGALTQPFSPNDPDGVALLDGASLYISTTGCGTPTADTTCPAAGLTIDIARTW